MGSVRPRNPTTGPIARPFRKMDVGKHVEIPV